MVGLPEETLDDVAAIASLIDTIGKLGKGIRGRPPRVRVSVSSFIPKPHTPCQWSAQDNEASLNQKHNMLQDHLRRGNVQLSWHDPRNSLLEAALSRGDRRLGQVIYTAWKKGCKLDTWSEFHDFSKWQQAFDECGVDPFYYAQRHRDPDELLPWQHINSGVSDTFLKREHQRMSSSDLTPDCRTQDCNLCGLQGLFPACRIKAQQITGNPQI